MSGKTRKVKTSSSPVKPQQAKSSESTEEIPLEFDQSGPLHITRSEEKEELCYLNDRLATYIDYVRSLQTEKDRHTERITTIVETHETHLSSIKSTYEKEINQLRKDLDRACNERAAAEIAQKHAEALADEMKREKHNLLNELSTIRRQLERAQAQLERETILRTQLENSYQSAQEQLALQTQIHQQELNVKRTEIQEQVSATKSVEFDSRLADELREIRNESMQALEQYREELDLAFQENYNILLKAKEDSLKDASLAKLEANDLRSKLEQAKNKINHLERLKEKADNDLSGQKERYENELRLLRDTEAALRQQLEDRLQEFTDLLAVKVALDQEIATYRKLLEGEESRCQLASPSRESSFSRSTTPRTTSSHSRKRGFDLDESVEQSSYSIERKDGGRIRIGEVDTNNAMFVEILSLASEDISLGQWKLVYRADGVETIYKFNRNLILKSGEKIKIWSGESKETHTPPDNLVMSGLKFFTGRRVTVSLLNGDEKEEATIALEYQEKQRTILYGKRRVHRADDGACGLM